MSPALIPSQFDFSGLSPEDHAILWTRELEQTIPNYALNLQELLAEFGDH
jgi:hypothetical protein